MSNGAIGIAAAVGIVAIALFHSRPAPSIKDAIPQTNGIPRFHLWKGDEDADRSIDLLGSGDHPVVGRLLEREGRYFTPKDGPFTGSFVTADYYAIDPGLDIGTFGAYRPSAQGYEADSFTLGLRVSPARLFAGTIAPDLVVTKEWAGVGLSVYPVQPLVSPAWTHVGVGAWYGAPFGGHAAGPPGWAFGLSFSIREF